MIPIPTDRFLLLASLALPLAFLTGLHPLYLPATLAYLGILFAALVADHLRLPRSGAFAVRRGAPPVLSLAREAQVTLEILYKGSLPLLIEYRDAPPLRFRDLARPAPIPVPPRSETSLSYGIVPLERGTHAFGRLHLRVRSRLGLAVRPLVFDIPTSVRVLPDVAPVARETGLLMRRGLRSTGLRNLRERGEGREFESLKEYGPDDEFRWIDWKATAKTGRLIARQYQAERNQNVLLLLDVGRHLSPRVGDLTRLDFAVNAALLLAHVAIEAGDQVGLLAFSSAIRAHVPPRRGRRQLVRIADALTPLRPDATEPDYTAAFAFLRTQVRRRALVVLFTDLQEPETNRVLLARLRGLLPVHLPFCLTLTDPDLERAASLRPRRVADAYLLATAREVQEDRRRTRDLLRSAGALVAEVPAEHLSMAAVRRYLEVKERGLL